MLFLPDVTRRDRQPERMDDPAIAAPQLERALRGIERLNRWSASARILWPPLCALLREHRGKLVRVLDIGTGSGDLPVALWQRARKSGFHLQIDGCDLSSTAVEIARRRAAACDAPLHFMQSDALREDIPEGYDAVLCSLFLHHLADHEAEAQLARMAAAAGRLVLVNDLVRSRAGLLLAYAATAALTSSPIVRIDGPLSVRGAFTVDEVKRMASRAGMATASVERRWPCRFLMTWWRDS